MYKVQERDFRGVWEDAPWFDDDLPIRFATAAEAEVGIEEFIMECEAAVVAGQLDDAPPKENFRVVPIN